MRDGHDHEVEMNKFCVLGYNRTIDAEDRMIAYHCVERRTVRSATETLKAEQIRYWTELNAISCLMARVRGTARYPPNKCSRQIRAVSVEWSAVEVDSRRITFPLRI